MRVGDEWAGCRRMGFTVRRGRRILQWIYLGIKKRSDLSENGKEGHLRQGTLFFERPLP